MPLGPTLVFSTIVKTAFVRRNSQPYSPHPSSALSRPSLASCLSIPPRLTFKLNLTCSTARLPPFCKFPKCCLHHHPRLTDLHPLLTYSASFITYTDPALPLPAPPPDTPSIPPTHHFIYPLTLLSPSSPLPLPLAPSPPLPPVRYGAVQNDHRP